MSFDQVGRVSSAALANDADWTVKGDRQAVGKATLSEALPHTPQYKAAAKAEADAPMFGDDPQWETIDPAELAELAEQHREEPESESEQEDPAALAALEADAPAIDDAQVDPDVQAREADAEAIPTAPPSGTVAIGAQPRAVAASAAQPAAAAAAAPTSAGNAHAAPYERKTKKQHKHNAKRDQYNREVVEHHAGNQFQISRPGVRVSGKDEMHLKGDFAYRYTITSGNQAQVADKIWEHELQHGNDRTGDRLALNPSHSRVLSISGVEVECVLSWASGQSAAWIAIDDLRGNHATIKRAVNRHAAKGQPKAANQAARDTAKPMKFRAVGGVADADTTDRGRYIVPGQKGTSGNQVADYLAKRVIRRWSNSDAPNTAKAAAASKKLEAALAAANKPIQAPTGKRQTINVMANLPHERAAAVAVDTALPGDGFFVPRGATYRREISMYKRTKKSSNLRQTWVYGFIGKDAGARQVADKSRRGWVPLRVLQAT